MSTFRRQSSEYDVTSEETRIQGALVPPLGAFTSSRARRTHAIRNAVAVLLGIAACAFVMLTLLAGR